ncbi:MucB/RseB C-terminal domain-containing protein [Methyloglobulus sp.]|uniref:MucB/RseB C-terminal domain-containing protein n=1 Tax=Methyloglobulus sp. TaxID=2518622 RepID=UPI00398A1444
MAQLLLVILFAAMGAVSAAENSLTAKQILQKMVKAMAVSNYQGTVVFLKNDKLEAMKYSHSAEKSKEQERLVSLNSPPREIIRNSDEVSCLFKLTRKVIIDHRPYEHSFIVDVPKNLDELDAGYHFEVVGEEDVAMLPSYVVAIQPKDDFRYARKIWIAKEHFLPMKVVVYGLSGVVLEQVVFTEMRVDKGSVRELNGSAEAAGFAQRADGAEAASSDLSGQAAFEVTALPQGFKQIFFSRKPLHQSDQPVDHLLLSDGLASVSVYLETKKAETTPDSRIPEGIHSVGAINSMSRTLVDSQLTVLGEVPAPTVKFIAEGIKFRNSAP